MIWLQAIRPRTLFNSISPAFIGSVMAIEQGTFNWLVCLFTFLTGLGLQISTNLSNDYFDFVKGADTAERKGPMRVTASGAVSVPAIKKACAISFGLTAISGSYLIWEGGVYIAAVFAIYTLLSYCYTGGPYPLAYLGLGDLFVLLLYGVGAVAVTYYLQTKVISMEAMLVGLGSGAISTAVINTNNLRDEEEDRKANKKTLVVRFGQKFGRWEYLCCILTAAIIPFFFIRNHPFCLIASLIFLPALFLIHSVFTIKDLRDFYPILPKTAQLLFLYALLFSIGWML